MTDSVEYTVRPHRTMTEIEALVAFIEARVEPLRVAAEYGSEERKVFESLLNLVAYIKGVAKSAVEHGEDPSVEFHSLTVITRRWDEHPDYQSAWDWDAP